MTTGRCRGIALTILLVAPIQVFAQEGVESRVRSLEDTVQLLERRVASLEAELHERSAPARVAPGKANWRKLENGMSESEVELLLGSPSKVRANPAITTWQYGSGYVQFDTDSRKVNGWSEP